MTVLDEVSNVHTPLLAIGFREDLPDDHEHRQSVSACLGFVARQELTGAAVDDPALHSQPVNGGPVARLFHEASKTQP